jgi:hypothetical protein
MAWKYNDTYIRAGRSWVGTATDEEGNTFDVTHPRNWMIWSDEDKAAAGLVWEDDPSDTQFDARFWWDATTPKSLDDIPQVDEDGNPIMMNGVQEVLWGLKSEWKEITKKQAASLLSKTDWYITRNAETGDAVPADITTYRAAVRTASNTIEASIDGAADHTAFVALFDTPVDADGMPTGNAPINDWPEEV